MPTSKSHKEKGNLLPIEFLLDNGRNTDCTNISEKMQFDIDRKTGNSTI